MRTKPPLAIAILGYIAAIFMAALSLASFFLLYDFWAIQTCESTVYVFGVACLFLACAWLSFRWALGNQFLWLKR